jgi:signal transduction histidine kinase
MLDLSDDDLMQGKPQSHRYIRPDGTPMPPEEVASERAFREQQLARDVEVGVITEKGTTIWTSVSAAPFPAVDRGVVIVTVDITERKRATEALAQSRQQLRALTTHWQTAIEAERARIAREIHDEFGQSMTALKLDVAWLIRHLPAGDEKAARLHGMNTLIDESIALMRRIATELRPTLLDDLGLNAALEWQANEFSRRSGLPCKLNLPKQDLDLAPALNTTLFRIFQETLVNLTRHARATNVVVSLQQTDQALILTICDNGIGIAADDLNDPGAVGLLGMRERAAQWGGETIIRGAPGEGTTVTVRIPLPASPLNRGQR